jgi:hypothetical protein
LVAVEEPDDRDADSDGDPVVTGAVVSRSEARERGERGGGDEARDREAEPAFPRGETPPDHDPRVEDGRPAINAPA